jgi:RNA polymerase sigma-70 factor (ECF subfamily)
MERYRSDIVEGLIQGQEEAYIYLFKEYFAELCAYAQRYVGRKEVAEEIVSEVFFLIWERRRTLHIRSSLRSYLFQSVYHNSISYLRELKKKETLLDYLERSFSEDAAFFFISEEESEQSLLLLEDLAEKIEKAISQLPPQQQKVFRLKRFEGKKNKEIAELLEVSVKTVELHLSRATLNLREKLNGLLPPFLLFILFRVEEVPKFQST